jgi:hypothetical protein
MKQDRFLVGILTGIVVLIIAALSVFFLRQDKQTYGPEDTPEGVVHNYVLAVINKDYQKAYNYLADLENKPSYDNFRRSFVTGSINPLNAGVKIGKADVTDEDATVEVSMLNTPSDPFGSEYNNVGVAQLVKQNGTWKISSMPTYNMWDYSWYQAPPK